jgi:CubicO group peptidase (beta-lactamase class C family)
MDNWQRKLDTFILQRMAATKLPAVSLALIRDGEVVYRRGYGLRDWRAGFPATPATLYGVGSITKSFTCLAIMQLQERGLLSIDDPIERYLPFDILPGGQKVLLRHLMSHTSGIPALGYAEHVLRQVIKPRPSLLLAGGPADMLGFMDGAADWTEAKPGERWFYLNEGFALLGAVVTSVSGVNYVDYVQEHILGPLGMCRSSFDRASVEADEDVAVPSYADREGRLQGADYCYGQITAEGGLISSVDDMARYVQMYLRGGTDPGGTPIVNAASLAEMTRPRVATPGEQLVALGGEATSGMPVAGSSNPGWYGYGLSLAPLGDHTVVRHGGSVRVATGEMAFVPALNAGVVLLASGGGYPLAQFAQYALAPLAGMDPEQLPFVLSERRLDALTGHYETFRGTTAVNVRRQGGFLIVESADVDTAVTTILVPARLADDGGDFWTIAGVTRLPVELRLLPHGGAELILERYKYRRTDRRL